MQFFGQGYFGQGYYAQAYFAGAAVAAVIDPWFPGRSHAGDSEITWRIRPEEKKAKKKKRHRHPLRVPKALQVIELPPPLEVPPIFEPPPVTAVSPLPQIRPEDLPRVAPPTLAPLPEPPGAHWSEYQHIPYTAEDELEDMYLVLAAVLKAKR